MGNDGTNEDGLIVDTDGITDGDTVGYTEGLPDGMVEATAVGTELVLALGASVRTVGFAEGKEGTLTNTMPSYPPIVTEDTGPLNEPL